MMKNPTDVDEQSCPCCAGVTKGLKIVRESKTHGAIYDSKGHRVGGWDESSQAMRDVLDEENKARETLEFSQGVKEDGDEMSSRLDEAGYFFGRGDTWPGSYEEYQKLTHSIWKELRERRGEKVNE